MGFSFFLEATERNSSVKSEDLELPALPGPLGDSPLRRLRRRDGEAIRLDSENKKPSQGSFDAAANWTVCLVGPFLVRPIRTRTRASFDGVTFPRHGRHLQTENHTCSFAWHLRGDMCSGPESMAMCSVSGSGLSPGWPASVGCVGFVSWYYVLGSRETWGEVITEPTASLVDWSPIGPDG